MRVSFGPTSHEPNPKSGAQGERPRQNGESGREYLETHVDEDQDTRKLRREMEESLKREEALRDRLKLQETLANKQVQELRMQIKRLTTENQKTPRTRDSISTASGMRSDRKRDGKSKEVRELQKSLDGMKAENEALQEKLKGLAEFVKVAGEMKTRAVNQCAAKEKIVRSLRNELHGVERLFEEERRHRIQTESELNSLRTYVDYISHKRREKMRGKIVQTDTSIPPKLIIGTGSSSDIDFAPSNTASFASLASSAASWRLKHAEREYQEETKRSKEKFDNAAEHKKQRAARRSSGTPPRHVMSTHMQTKNHNRMESDSDVQRSKYSSSSASELESTQGRRMAKGPKEASTKRAVQQHQSESNTGEGESRDFKGNGVQPASATKFATGNHVELPRAYKARRYPSITAISDMFHDARLSKPVA